MKNKNLHVRISEKRMLKLKAYAEAKEKTLTQLIEDWIDRLPTASTD
ncbi:CopG family transcriptional regulator [Microcoleus sp. FACHB-53]|nr:CopG family transcriptional regulator [Microcoleus sp. FACHB-53]MBD2126882.1 CopG family transcriptional regulator [Microcoleus sp. FACHB-1]